MQSTDQEDFKIALKELVETHKSLKKINAEAKEARDRLKNLKVAVLGFMQVTSLDVCHISHQGKEGEIAVRTSKRTKTLKKEDAITQIQKYLTEETSVDQAEERASEIWDAVQNTRAVETHKDISVKKF
jgi:hypothetical protein